MTIVNITDLEDLKYSAQINDIFETLSEEIDNGNEIKIVRIYIDKEEDKNEKADIIKVIKTKEEFEEFKSKWV